MNSRKPAAIVFAIATAQLLAITPTHAQDPARPGIWREVPYGQAVAAINCNPLAACLVALEQGETVLGRFLADSSGWEVEPGTTGPSGRIPILAIKPHRCDATSNLFVTTDRRVYSFVLSSPACDPATLKAAPSNFDQIKFTYPADFAHLWQDQEVPIPSSPPNSTTQAVRLDQLNFSYTFDSGRFGLEPKVVYDDGHRTFIVLRTDDLKKDAPAVFLQGQDGKLETVNFTPPAKGGDTYTIDRVAKQLVLVSGPKANQRTTITNHRAER